MDAEPHGNSVSQGLRGVEGKVRCEGPTPLQPAQPVPLDTQRAAWRDPEAAHLRGVSQQLPLDPRSNWRWILLLSNLDATRVLRLENSTVIRVLNAAYF